MNGQTPAEVMKQYLKSPKTLFKSLTDNGRVSSKKLSTLAKVVE
jgi:hypothetical protein